MRRTTFTSHLCTVGARFKECNVRWKSSRGGRRGVALACARRRHRTRGSPSDAKRLEQRRPTVTLRCIFIGGVAWKERDSCIVRGQTHYTVRLHGLQDDCDPQCATCIPRGVCRDRNMDILGHFYSRSMNSRMSARDAVTVTQRVQNTPT